jgi:hypothetical protein
MINIIFIYEVEQQSGKLDIDKILKMHTTCQDFDMSCSVVSQTKWSGQRDIGSKLTFYD